jgi:hypothetical protein
MNTFYVGQQHLLPRRTFLRALGVTVGLPLLEAMVPSFSHGAETKLPRRMVAVETNMGIMPQFFFPETAGADYAPTPYLEKLAEHRKNLSVFSGVSHPGVTGGHMAEKCFLTGSPHPDRGGFKNWVSIDQYCAEHIGSETRYPSLTLAMSSEGGQTLSFTRSGSTISAERSPRKLFEKLFVQGKASEVEARVEALRQGQSTLDFVAGQAKRLQRSLSKNDQERVDQYFSSVRDLEQRLHSSEAWEYKPKPVVDAKPPEDIEDAKEFVKKTALMFDVIKLALQTDSSRLITLFVDTTVIHSITHHGNRPEVVAELRGKEEAQFGALAGFLTALQATPEDNQNLLDRTMVLYGTCMGSANAHSNVNLPVLLAGGGFKHGAHYAFDKTNNYPLANLYLSMIQRLGIEADKFATSTGTMRGLEMAG